MFNQISARLNRPSCLITRQKPINKNKNLFFLFQLSYSSILFCCIQFSNTTKCHILDHVKRGSFFKKPSHNFNISFLLKYFLSPSDRNFSSQKLLNSFFIQCFQGKVKPIFGLSAISAGSNLPIASTRSFFLTG